MEDARRVPWPHGQSNRMLMGVWHLGTGRVFEKPERGRETGSTRP